MENKSSGVFFLFKIKPHMKPPKLWPQSMHFSRRQFPLNSLPALICRVDFDCPEVRTGGWG